MRFRAPVWYPFCGMPKLAKLKDAKDLGLGGWLGDWLAG